MGLSYVTADLLHQDGVIRHEQSRLTKLLLDEFIKRHASR